MPRPRDVDYLQEDEAVLLDERRHPLSVVDDVVGILVFSAIVAGATTIGIRRFVPELWLPVGVPVVAVVVALALAAMTARWWRTMTTLYTVTDARVYEAYGRLRWMLLQTTFDKITDLHVRQGIIGRRFGYGSLRLMTAGTGLNLHGVRRPWDVKQQVEQARSGFVDRLVGTSTQPRSDDEAAPRTRGMGELVWQAGPQPASVLGAFVSSGVTLLAAVAVGLGGAFGGAGFAILLAAVMALFAVMGVVRAIILLRYTRYHVHGGGVVVTAGWLTRRRVEATYSKVTDVQTTQGVLGRMFGFGDIRVNTAGSDVAPIVFQGVADPDRVKAMIDEARGSA